MICKIITVRVLHKGHGFDIQESKNWKKIINENVKYELHCLWCNRVQALFAYIKLWTIMNWLFSTYVTSGRVMLFFGLGLLWTKKTSRYEWNLISHSQLITFNFECKLLILNGHYTNFFTFQLASTTKGKCMTALLWLYKRGETIQGLIILVRREKDFKFAISPSIIALETLEL